MQVYSYDGATGEYLETGTARVCPGREAWPDTEAGKFLVPANATTIAPPAAQAGHTRCFQGGTWAQVIDDRGETWWKAHGESVIVTTLGDPTLDGLTASEPAAPPPTAEQLRTQSYLADAERQELITELLSATPVQIDSYVDDRVTDLTSAKAMLVKIIKVLALVASE